MYSPESQVHAPDLINLCHSEAVETRVSLLAWYSYSELSYACLVLTRFCLGIKDLVLTEQFLYRWHQKINYKLPLAQRETNLQEKGSC